MAYGVKWEFNFESTHGVDTLIRVSKNGYSGSKTTRPLGKAPVLKLVKNGNIKTTSLSFDCECQVDGEFSEFYTTDPREFKVQVFRGSTSIFEGFIVTELFSEPLISPPYDVSINAVDGLAELKMVTFTAPGTQTLRAHLVDILANTGLTHSLKIVSALAFGMGTASYFVRYASINLDYLEGKTCYEVLEYILATLQATISLYNSSWIIVRENDVTIDQYGSVSCYTTGRTGSVTSNALNFVTSAVTKMNAVPYWSYSDNMWPVGKLTRRVEAAKKSVTIEAPWNVNAKSMYPSVEDNGWSLSGAAVSFDSTHKCYSFTVSGGFVHASAYVNNSNYDVELKFKASCPGGTGPYQTQLVITVTFAVSGGSTYYYSETNGWTTTTASAFTTKMKSTNMDKDPATADEYTFIIPAAALGAGTLNIQFGGTFADLYSITAEVKMNKGYRDTILINNGARGEAPDVTIGGGRVTSDTVMSTDSLQGIWLDETTVSYRFSDGQGHTNKDYLSIAALGYARSVALPRLRVLGVLDVPAGVRNPPLVLRILNQDYWIETYEWDLLNDEINVDSLSLPTATLSVTSETVKPIE